MRLAPELVRRRLTVHLHDTGGPKGPVRKAKPQLPREADLTSLAALGDPQQFIEELYWQLLGREPDPAGFEHFWSQWHSGRPRQFLLYQAITSPEVARQRRTFHGVWTPQPAEQLLALEGDAFLQAAYRSVFFRDPDPAGAAHYGSHLRLGRQKADLLRELAESDEARSLGVPLHGLEALQSAPRDLSWLQGIEDCGHFLREAYWHILGRTPDLDGYRHYFERVQNTSHAEVLEHLSQSAEGAARGIRWVLPPVPSMLRRNRQVRSLWQRLLDRWPGSAERRAAQQQLDYVRRDVARLPDKLMELQDGLKQVEAQLLRLPKLEAEIAALQTAASKWDAWRQESHAGLQRLDRESAARLTKLQDSIIPNVVQIVTNALQEPKELLAQIPVEQRLLAGDMTRAINGQIAVVHSANRHSAEQLSAKVDSYAVEAFRRMDEKLRLPPVRVGENLSVLEIDGFLLATPAEDWRLSAFYALRGHLEPGTMALFRRLVQPGMTVVDIGANVGIYTLYAARQVGKTGAVYSFEPTPRTFEILQGNVQINALLEAGTVHLHRMAIADHTGELPMAVYGENGTHNSLFPKSANDATINVPVSRLDDVLPAGIKVDIIKVDAEGAEPLIFRGMPEVLRNNRQAQIVLEFAPGHLERSGTTPAAFLDELMGQFTIQVVDEASGALREPSPAELTGGLSTNLLLRQKEGQ